MNPIKQTLHCKDCNEFCKVFHIFYKFVMMNPPLIVEKDFLKLHKNHMAIWSIDNNPTEEELKVGMNIHDTYSSDQHFVPSFMVETFGLEKGIKYYKQFISNGNNSDEFTEKQIVEYCYELEPTNEFEGKKIPYNDLSEQMQQIHFNDYTEEERNIND